MAQPDLNDPNTWEDVPTSRATMPDLNDPSTWEDVEPGSTPESAIPEQHPDLGFWQRQLQQLTNVKKPEVMLHNLRRIGFEAKQVGPWDFALQKPGGKWYKLESPKAEFADIPDVAGDVFTMGTSMAAAAPAAAAATTAAGPVAGFGAGMAAAGVGGGLGEAFLVGLGKLAGQEYPTEETLKGIGQEALWNAAGEGVARGAIGGVRKILGKSFAPASEMAGFEAKKAAASLAEREAAAPVAKEIIPEVAETAVKEAAPEVAEQIAKPASRFAERGIAEIPGDLTDDIARAGRQDRMIPTPPGAIEMPLSVDSVQAVLNMAKREAAETGLTFVRAQVKAYNEAAKQTLWREVTRHPDLLEHATIPFNKPLQGEELKAYLKGMPVEDVLTSLDEMAAEGGLKRTVTAASPPEAIADEFMRAQAHYTPGGGRTPEQILRGGAFTFNEPIVMREGSSRFGQTGKYGRISIRGISEMKVETPEGIVKHVIFRDPPTNALVGSVPLQKALGGYAPGAAWPKSMTGEMPKRGWGDVAAQAYQMSIERQRRMGEMISGAKKLPFVTAGLAAGGAGLGPGHLFPYSALGAGWIGWRGGKLSQKLAPAFFERRASKIDAFRTRAGFNPQYLESLSVKAPPYLKQLIARTLVQAQYSPTRFKAAVYSLSHNPDFRSFITRQEE